jgi:RNA polymerase sigma-70 factor (ECF subfamily)
MHNGKTMAPATNGEALTATFQRLSERLAGTAWHMLGHREDAREAVQETFLRCWRKRAGLKSFATLDAWVFSVLLNTSRDFLRRRRFRRVATLPREELMPPSRREPLPAAVAAASEREKRLREAIRDLPEAQREVFLLRQNGDLAYATIAEVLGIPVGTAKTRMRAALQRLREALIDERRARTP